MLEQFVGIADERMQSALKRTKSEGKALWPPLAAQPCVAAFLVSL